jgi:hypothetical protein
MNVVRLQALHRAPPPPPSSRLCQLWSRKEDKQRAWNQDRKAVWDQVGISHCQHNSQVTVWDEARFRWGHNDQSYQGHQCSETTLIVESWFHISTPLGIEPGSLMMGSKGLTHWTSETVYECSEIAGSPQVSVNFTGYNNVFLWIFVLYVWHKSGFDCILLSHLWRKILQRRSKVKFLKKLVEHLILETNIIGWNVQTALK